MSILSLMASSLSLQDMAYYTSLYTISKLQDDPDSLVMKMAKGYYKEHKKEL